MTAPLVMRLAMSVARDSGAARSRFQRPATRQQQRHAEINAEEQNELHAHASEMSVAVVLAVAGADGRLLFRC